MNWLKKNWKIVLIVVLLLFSMSKCTQSCNRQGKLDKMTIEYNSLDSTYKADKQILTDSIKNQQSYINVLEERVTGLKDKNSALDTERARTDEANKRAASAESREAQLRKQLNKK